MSLRLEWSRHRCTKAASCQLDFNGPVTADAMLPVVMAYRVLPEGARPVGARLGVRQAVAMVAAMEVAAMEVVSSTGEVAEAASVVAVPADY